ncbi:uncharacterized protein LOC131690733 [Topomyia yanbarensis]|uniref:uncharacterized protein LOC131690733 n=1 Tax=Topomyia yanbarensis TaxID=2498891 RepID=UPI00273B54B2|nr:uncharacterized protein LOC131690733 [Topomyia yanbarensis]
MFKGFIKFNGYAVAISCINYAITRILETNVEGSVLQKIPWMNNLLATNSRPESVIYIGFLVACVIFLMGIFWECKVLMIPFMISYVVVLYEETNGTFLMNHLWQVAYTFYAAVSVLLLLMLGICKGCRGDDGKTGDNNRKNHRRSCLEFCCCCFRCYRNPQKIKPDISRQCSCETLNIRVAEPHEKHYHRVIFV